MPITPLGSSKSSPSGSSSFLSGSNISSSCVCDYTVGVVLLLDNKAQVTITNTGTCPLVIMGNSWAIGGATSSSETWPQPIAAGAILNYIIEEAYDIRGLYSILSTDCYETTFNIPVE